MEWFIAILAVAVLGLAAVAAGGGLGELGSFKVDRPQLSLPESDLTATDLARVRFAVVPRGYAMNQVDQLLDRLQRQLGDPPEPVAVRDEYEPEDVYEPEPVSAPSGQDLE